ncbi:hypothetical protein AURDEDRAFT_155696 [Auricularia subglabra TFB-10046 SS5]|nr:hypothetical protein AURDEDRAFT_155696 [Auricularia subglabra TFB-10046 SS5]
MYHAGGAQQHAPPPAGPPPQRTEYVALSTQHVFIASDASMPMVARVSVCDFHGNSLYDTFVQPTHPVTDYRTPLTGLELHHLQTGSPFQEVQQRVASLLRGKIVVGHQLWFDFAVLNISHLAIDTRDCALFLPFRTSLGAQADEILPLATLVWRLMRRRITAGYQHPVSSPFSSWRSALMIFGSPFPTRRYAHPA